ncbi:PLAC8 family-domain-containing protein [Rhodotorula diobovata]|uniref:PLAC8 family-domain-containing protein n=1 Tax=Rhodotorula diobovata TaxID=5288 RepID=A0A5C5FKQ4_9BASI|nr:PLAC8 family-domain-containing protein [Rhodotorula diobovata]
MSMPSSHEKSAPVHPAPVYQQPQAAPMMTHEAPPAHNAGAPGHERDWSTGLCACKNDCGGFCLAFWCPCIAYGQYKSRFDSLRFTGRPLPKEQVEGCGSAGVLYLTIHCLAGVGWILDFMARGDLRKRYGIKGSAFGDCCTACWCMPCTQRQHHRELLVEEEQQWQAMQSGGGPPQMHAYPPQMQGPPQTYGQ